MKYLSKNDIKNLLNVGREFVSIYTTKYNFKDVLNLYNSCGFTLYVYDKCRRTVNSDVFCISTSDYISINGKINKTVGVRNFVNKTSIFVNEPYIIVDL